MRSATSYKHRPLPNFGERCYKKINKMTDTNSSGAPVAPAAETSAPAASAETPAGTFGGTRGSGLARGKRSSSAAGPKEAQVKADYKPMAIQVITPQREYKNPFASPEPANAPAPEPVKVEEPAAPAPVSTPEPKAVEETPVAPAQASPEPVEEKAEIQILPPAEASRPAVSWESASSIASRPEGESSDGSRRDDRPTFRPDRRPEPGPSGSRPEGRDPRPEGRDIRRDAFRRQPRDPRDERQPRDPRDERQPRDPRDERREAFSAAPYAQAPKPASKGFFGWLKGLFGGSKPEQSQAERESGGGQFNEGHRHRRRHRGGRGQGGGPGFRSDRPEQASDRPSQGENFENRGGEPGGGQRRRRHRGGRGRDRGGEPRSEGHQGGGAI